MTAAPPRPAEPRLIRAPIPAVSSGGRAGTASVGCALALLVGLLVGLLGAVTPTRAAAAERDRIEAFLQVTGFDVALDSIALSAADAPAMLGFDPAMFGPAWDRLVADVFDTAGMRGMALDILEDTLDDALLAHAAEFYASDLGQRLVAVENASHMARDEGDGHDRGAAILERLRAVAAPRLAILERMNAAIDAGGQGLHALQEIQLRFLMAASAAGVIELRLDEGELRAILAENLEAMRAEMRESALASAAETYRDFTDAELTRYAEALEAPEMRRVYELLNAVQYEIMANRFEALALRMGDLQPGQDI